MELSSLSFTPRSGLPYLDAVIADLFESGLYFSLVSKQWLSKPDATHQWMTPSPARCNLCITPRAAVAKLRSLVLSTLGEVIFPAFHAIGVASIPCSQKHHLSVLKKRAFLEGEQLWGETIAHQVSVLMFQLSDIQLSGYRSQLSL